MKEYIDKLRSEADINNDKEYERIMNYCHDLVNKY
jgi:hypothetical protein